MLGPVSSPIIDAVADVTERHKMPMVSPGAAPTSIYRKGRKFIFSMNPPSEVTLEGLIDLAAKKGLKTVARSSAKPFSRWTTTPSSADSGSIGTGSRSRTSW